MAETVIMPKLGFDMAEGVLVRWVKKENDPVKKGDVLAEIETDKATVEVESSFSGIVARHLVEAGTSVPVGAPIAMIAAEGEKISDTPAVAQKGAEQSVKPEKIAEPGRVDDVVKSGNDQQRQIASPLARRIALEKHIDLSRVRGSGPGGRIVRQDIEAFIALSGDKASIPLEDTQPVVQNARKSETRITPVSKLRTAIARRMSESKQSIPHFYVTHLYHADRMMQFRSEYNTMVPESEKLSVNDLIIKAAAMALRKFPGLNASFADQGILIHDHIHVGMAVSVEGGLLTVVIQDADKKDLKTIVIESRNLVNRAREGKVKPEDIEGSTFSISNLGMFEVDEFAAIINPPEAAILAVGSVHEAVITRDGTAVVEKVFKATLSADHRVTDGVTAAQFLQELGKYIENPVGLIMP